MKLLKVSVVGRSQVMVRYEDDYGVATFILTREQTFELGRALNQAHTETAFSPASGFTSTLINDKDENEDA